MNRQDFPPEGTSPESFEKLFEEMNDLLQFTLENIDRPPQRIPKDIEKRLAELEQSVDEFCESNEKFIQRSIEAGHGRTNTNHLTPSERQQLARSQGLTAQANAKIEDLSKNRSDEPKAIENETDRRKHFKRITRNQSWKI